jgi:type IV pilus assembly protein PilO
VQELIDRILNLPDKQKLGVLAGAVILLLLFDYFFLYSSQSQNIAKYRQDIENSQGERDKKKKLAANLPKLKQQLQDLDGMLKEAVAKLPDRKEIPDLLSSISSKAREAGLEIMIFRPKGENYQEFYAEIPVDIVVQGGFHSAVTFFDELGRLSRLVNVQNIEIRNPKPQDDRVSVETSAMAVTFRFLDEAERKRVAEEKARAAKARR